MYQMESWREAPSLEKQGRANRITSCDAIQAFVIGAVGVGARNCVAIVQALVVEVKLRVLA